VSKKVDETMQELKTAGTGGVLRRRVQVMPVTVTWITTLAV